jgi:hypothetical protein
MLSDTLLAHLDGHFCASARSVQIVDNAAHAEISNFDCQVVAN